MKRYHRRRREQAVTALLFLLPWFLSLVIMWYGPIASTLVLSFTRYRLVGRPSFIGIGNYLAIFQDRFFWIGLRTTFTFVAMYIPTNALMALFTAYLLSLDLRLKGLWRSIVYVPSVLPALAILVLGKFVFYPYGLVNTVIGIFGVSGPLWLANPALIIPACVMLMVWQCGIAMVVYLGAMQNVSREYYEAADIDGLSKLRQFFSITIPLISPALFFRLIVDLIFALMIFVPGLVLPEGNVPGGPSNASRFYALHVYEKAFQRFRIGEASALAMVLLLTSAVLVWIARRMAEQYVYYEI